MRLIQSVMLIVPLVAAVSFAQHGRGGGGGGGVGARSGGPARSPAPAGSFRSGGGGVSRPGGGAMYNRPTSPNPPPRRGTGSPGAGRVGGGGEHGVGGHRGPRGFLVPYPVVIGGYYGVPLYGGYPYSGYDSYGTPYDQQPAQQQPDVLYNPDYQQEGANPQVRDYSDGQLPPPGPMYAQRQDPEPTIYLVALQDGTVLQTLSFWVQGDTLSYIARDSNTNRISLDRVDRALSNKLNRERGLDLKL